MHIYIPFYNSDMTEGRGPMVPKRFAFTTLAEAIKYINSQLGVMGRKPAGGSWGNEGDWAIQEFPVIELAQSVKEAEDAQLRQKVLSRLNADEKRVLGL
jgi:hypothetical protein